MVKSLHTAQLRSRFCTCITVHSYPLSALALIVFNKSFLFIFWPSSVPAIKNFPMPPYRFHVVDETSRPIAATRAQIRVHGTGQCLQGTFEAPDSVPLRSCDYNSSCCFENSRFTIVVSRFTRPRFCGKHGITWRCLAQRGSAYE